ncbi:TetR/AcrR family transcriptional regulator, partial [Singulisphaera rosea]
MANQGDRIRTPRNSSVGQGGADVRNKILSTATELFYNQCIRAVGVDLVVEKAGVAKTSLYRHFGAKDDLVVAFLQRMDQDFWETWDKVAEEHPTDPRAELNAQLDWIGERVARPEYRGCPQINVAAEYPELDHPARKLAKAHKLEMRRRLRVIVEKLNCESPEELAGQLAVLINGAFVSTPMYEPGEATTLLRRAADALITAR